MRSFLVMVSPLSFLVGTLTTSFFSTTFFATFFAVAILSRIICNGLISLPKNIIKSTERFFNEVFCESECQTIFAVISITIF